MRDLEPLAGEGVCTLSATVLSNSSVLILLLMFPSSATALTDRTAERRAKTCNKLGEQSFSRGVLEAPGYPARHTRLTAQHVTERGVHT